MDELGNAGAIPAFERSTLIRLEHMRSRWIAARLHDLYGRKWADKAKGATQ